MNWKLIFQLSLFGLTMGIATVFFIPSNIEPYCWLAIFIVCAYIIAKNCNENFFYNGLCVSFVNSIWITAAHLLLYKTYIDNHPQEAAMMHGMPMPTHPRVMMILSGPVIGIMSGMVLGLFSFVASKLVKRK